MTVHNYRYLLDTNILSDLIKHPNGIIAQKIATSDIEQLCCTSLIVACELRYGACKKGSPQLSAKVEQLLDILPVLPLEENVAQQYGEIRTELERRGQLIGGNDLLIAAHALTLRMTVVTANIRDFSRVSGLAVENWLK
jgi:tRNA(fMet)-specific endonuclease VapC